MTAAKDHADVIRRYIDGEYPPQTTDSAAANRAEDALDVLIAERDAMASGLRFAEAEYQRLRAVLQEIADTDYRGNRSPESEKAWRALNGT